MFRYYMFNCITTFILLKHSEYNKIKQLFLKNVQYLRLTKTARTVLILDIDACNTFADTTYRTGED